MLINSALAEESTISVSPSQYKFPFFFLDGCIDYAGDDKYAHLYKLDKASENLKLFTADLLDYNSMYSAIAGCTGVFHVACPVPSTTVSNPEARTLSTMFLDSKLNDVLSIFAPTCLYKWNRF